MVEVRQASARDASEISRLNDGVQQIHADAHPWMFKQPDAGSFSAEDAIAFIQRPGHLAFIAELDGQAVGYTFAEERRRPETGRHHARSMMFIHEISVSANARRRGVGRALITTVRDYGRSVGIELLALETWEFNTGAQSFFKSCGLSPARTMLWTQPDEL